MTLADTSVWIELFRRGKFKTEFDGLIARDQLCTHPFVVAELACGSLPDRRRTLRDLDSLLMLPIIATPEIRFMIETRGLSSKGIGFIDAQLIGSCLTTPGTQLWTIDGALARVADSLGIRAQIS